MTERLHFTSLHLVLNLLLVISVSSYVVFLNRNSQSVHGLFLSAFSPSVLPTHLKYLQGKFNSYSQCGGNWRLQKMYCKNWKQFQRWSLTWTLVRIFTKWFRLAIRSSSPGKMLPTMFMMLLTILLKYFKMPESLKSYLHVHYLQRKGERIENEQRMKKTNMRNCFSQQLE